MAKNGFNELMSVGIDIGFVAQNVRWADVPFPGRTQPIGAATGMPRAV